MVAAVRYWNRSSDSCDALREALKALRVWESQAEDLSYPEGDPRRIMFANELPQDWHDARRELQEAVVFHAARVGGETPASADCYADQPEGDHPFNVERAKLAGSLVWNLAPIRPWYRGPGYYR